MPPFRSIDNILADGKKDVVLFLGAGFSHQAKLPVMTKFGEFSERYLEDIKQNANPTDEENYRNYAPMFLESGRVFRAFQEYCVKGGLLSSGEGDNLETIFCIAEALRESGVEHLDLSGNRYSTEMLMSHIQLWLWKIYHWLRPVANDLGPDEIEQFKPYNDFFRMIKAKDIGRRLTVITTNYDLLYEHYSYCHKMPCVNPLISDDEAVPLIAGNGSEEWAIDNRYTASLTPYTGGYFEWPDHTKYGNSPFICKLHGSVNYFYNMAESRDIIHVADDLGDSTPIGRSRLWEGSPAILAMDSLWNIRNKYGTSFVPAIIPPTYAKLTQQKWLRRIWNCAILALSKAKYIVFIGYSMPPSDGFMRAMLQGAFSMRTTKPKVYVIDPCESVHERYYDLFHDMYQHIQCSSFCDAMNNWQIKKVLDGISENT